MQSAEKDKQTARILLCFQEKMMVQENPIKLEKMMAWSRRREADQGKLADL